MKKQNQLIDIIDKLINLFDSFSKTKNLKELLNYQELTKTLITTKKLLLKSESQEAVINICVDRTLTVIKELILNAIKYKHLDLEFLSTLIKNTENDILYKKTIFFTDNREE